MGPLLAIPALLGATTGSIATGAGVGTGFSAFSAIGGKLVSSLVLGGLSVGLSLLLRPPVPEPQSGSIETQQAVPPRTFVYGRMEIAGSIAFKEQGLPPDAGQLWKVTLLHDGEVDAFETIKADDNICLLDIDGWVTNAFIQGAAQHVQIFMHNGADDQAADANLMAAYPDLWTADHKLSGIAYIVAVFWGTSPEDFMGAYPNSEPVIKAVIRGRRVFDPRDPAQDPDDPTTFLWSDNPALCCLDWISLHPKGYRIDRAKLDIPSFVVMANRCDELITLTSGGSEKRYRVATQVSLKETRTAVLARLREACDGHLYLTGEGKWALRGGEWTAPTVTLDVGLGHILDLEMRDGMDALSRYNELSLRYLSPDHQYGEAECDPWQGTADPEFIAGKVKTRQLDLLQVPSYTQARRLAKLMMAFDNPTFVGRTTTNFYGLNTVGERNVVLNWSEPGEDIDGPFWVGPDLELGADGATVSMSLRAADPTAYDWDPATEEGEAVPLLPPVDLNFTEGVPPANPSDFAITEGDRSVLCSWTPPADAAFYIARVWRAAAGAGFANAFEVSGPRYLPRHPDGTATTNEMTYTDPVAVPDDWEYYLTVENPVGDRNTEIGPLSTIPPVVPWVPTDLGAALKAWWNADDHGTVRMTDDGSGLISSWTSSVGGMVITATTTARPTWTSTAFNAHAGLTFNGTANCFVSTSLGTLPTGSTGGEVWMAASNTDGGASTRVAFQYGTSAAAADRTMRKVLSGTVKLQVSDNSTNATDAASGILFTGAHVFSGNWAGTAMGGRMDGRAATGATIATLNTGTTRFRLGASNGAGAAFFWQGVVRHFIVTTTLTATEREQLEGWMAWDGGLEGNLPALHPYKSAPPTV